MHALTRVVLSWNCLKGVTSWLSLVFPKWEMFFGFVRDAYEAYVVYTFIGLLIAVLEDGKGHEYLIDLLADHVAEEQKVQCSK